MSFTFGGLPPQPPAASKWDKGRERVYERSYRERDQNFVQRERDVYAERDRDFTSRYSAFSSASQDYDTSAFLNKWRNVEAKEAVAGYNLLG